MAVYVDDMKARVGNMIMCHMVADSLDELHGMAKTIGVHSKWFQNKNRSYAYPHYDISLAKRALAVQWGAKEVSQKEIIRVIQSWRKTEEGAEKLAYADFRRRMIAAGWTEADKLFTIFGDFRPFHIVDETRDYLYNPFGERSCFGDVWFNAGSWRIWENRTPDTIKDDELALVSKLQGWLDEHVIKDNPVSWEWKNISACPSCTFMFGGDVEVNVSFFMQEGEFYFWDLELQTKLTTENLFRYLLFSIAGGFNA